MLHDAVTDMDVAGQLQRRQPVSHALGVVYAGSVAQEQLGCVPVAVDEGLVEGGQVLVVESVHVSPGVQEEHHDVQVPLGRALVEGRLPPDIGRSYLEGEDRLKLTSDALFIILVQLETFD